MVLLVPQAVDGMRIQMKNEVLSSFLSGKSMVKQISHSFFQSGTHSFFQSGKACALYPALEEKFGFPLTLAGYEIEKCLGRGEQGEGWKIKNEPYILKVLYEIDDGITDGNAIETSRKACTFAKHMSKRDPTHFIECLKVGVE